MVATRDPLEAHDRMKRFDFGNNWSWKIERTAVYVFRRRLLYSPLIYLVLMSSFRGRRVGKTWRGGGVPRRTSSFGGGLYLINISNPGSPSKKFHNETTIWGRSLFVFTCISRLIRTKYYMSFFVVFFLTYNAFCILRSLFGLATKFKRAQSLFDKHSPFWLLNLTRTC